MFVQSAKTNKMITRREIIESIFNDIAKNWTEDEFMQEQYNHLISCPVDEFIKETGIPLKQIRFDLFYV